VVEITPEKKIVWEFVDHTHIKSINQIQVLGPAPLRDLLYLGVMEN
jgi:hypothetical protein